MRVAYVVSGIGEYGLKFAELLSNACDIHLYIHQSYFSPNHPRPKDRLEITWLSWPRQRDLRSILFTFKLAGKIRNWKPDVVHFLNISAWHPLLLFLLKPIPIVTTVHDITHHPGDRPSRRVPSFVQSLMVANSNAIIVHGEGLRDAAIRNLPVSPRGVYSLPLIPSLTPDDFDKHLKPNDGIFRILFFGRIYEYKGLAYLLDAVPLIRAKVPNARLIIAGQGDDLSSYQSLDRPWIEIHNRFIPSEQAARLFFEADVLVLPYIEASQSGPLMIAAAFAVPVVVTNVGEISSFVRSYATGLVVQPRDPVALASAIINLALDRSLAASFCTNSRFVMESVCSPANITREVIRVYQKARNNENV